MDGCGGAVRCGFPRTNIDGIRKIASLFFRLHPDQKPRLRWSCCISVAKGKALSLEVTSCVNKSSMKACCRAQTPESMLPLVSTTASLQARSERAATWPSDRSIPRATRRSCFRPMRAYLNGAGCRRARVLIGVNRAVADVWHLSPHQGRIARRSR